MDARHLAAHTAGGVQQHRIGLDAQLTQRGHEETRLVLAITEAAPHYLLGSVRLVAANPQIDRDITDVLSYPPVHGPDGVEARPRAAHDAVDTSRDEGGHDHLWSGKRGVPLRD